MSLRIGAIGVQKVSSKLLEQGFLVSLPVFDEGYDLITDWRGKLYRVQVKSTMGPSDTKPRNHLKFMAVKGPGYGYGAKLGGNRLKVTYTKTDCDAFIFYHIPLEALFIVPRSKLPKTKSVYLATNSSWRDNWDVLKFKG